jgi:hypothetical protein
MLELTLRYPASALAGKLRLTRDDVQMLRRWMFPFGLQSETDAWRVLAIHRAAQEKSLDWSRWFVEAMTDFFVRSGNFGPNPDAERADCLMAMIAPEGVISNADELDLLLHVMELGGSCADTLPALALDQLRLALETGDGAYAARRSCKRNGISVEDLDLVYRIVRDKLERGRLCMTVREAAAMSRIDVVVRGRMNHPGWRRLVDSLVSVADKGGAPRGWLRVAPTEHHALDDAA